MKKKIICIITARKNSKGIKNKNLKKINNKELIFYPIKAAKKSKLIDEVVVTTDSKKIANISKNYGANVPFLRPRKFSTDSAKSFDAINHCLNFFFKKKKFYDYFVLLEPTSPFTSTKDIDKGINKLIKNHKIADSLVTVTKVEQSHPNFLSRIKKNNLITPYQTKNFNFKRRQDLSRLYYFDGSLYISDVKTYLKKETFNHKKTLAMELPKYKSMEIDDLTDLKLASLILSKNGFK